MADGGCGGYQPPDNGWGRGNRPVINVSWNDAQAYVQWLSQKAGKAYRLPTAEEWEIAARAGSATNYYWGNDVGRNNANCDGCGSEWDNRKTAPVGSFKPNAFGLYDMMGNVWQWTDSCWKDNCSRRLFYGGSWNHRPEDMRATTRNWFDTSKRMRYLGFRVAYKHFLEATPRLEESATSRPTEQELRTDEMGLDLCVKATTKVHVPIAAPDVRPT